MKSPVDISNQEGLKTFLDISTGVLDSNLASITGKPLEISLTDTMKYAPQDFTESFPSGVVMIATEGQTGFEIGMIFTVQDITAIADMMLMGDGESKDMLDADTKDAVSEIANQFFGGLVVPVETQTGKKVQFRVDNVAMLDAGAFQGDAYIGVDLSGKLKDKPLQVCMFFDEDFGTIFNAQEQTIDTSSFFGATEADEPAQGAGKHSHSANMDMLLDIEIPVSVRMGTAKLFLKDILGLGPGNIVELDQNADESIELVINGKLIARGEVVIVDGYFGFRIKEIISKAERLRKLKD